MKRLTYITQYKDIDYYLFKPSVFSRYWFGYKKEDEPDYWKKRVHSMRMLKLLFFNKYRVVYAVKDGIAIGHLVVSYNFKEIENATRRDVVIGPKWVAPSYRGLGYGTEILNFVLSSDIFSFDFAYEMISGVNYASIRVAEKCGYIKVSNARRGKFGKVLFDKNGSWCIYRYSNRDKGE